MAQKTAARHGNSRARRIYVVLIPLLVLSAVVNLFYGAVPIPPGEVMDILFGDGGDNPARLCSTTRWQVRPSSESATEPISGWLS